MASIYTYRNILHMNVRVDGKQYRKSTGLPNTKTNKQQVIKEILPQFIESVQDPTKEVNLSYYIDKFLQEKQHIAKEISYKRYKAITDNWIRVQYGSKSLSSIKPSVIKKFVNTQYDLGKSAKTIDLYLTIFGGILQEAVYDGVIDSNPVRSLKRKKKTKPTIQPFSPSEVKLLLSYSSGWFRNYIGIASHLGLRSGELIGLKWADITETHITIQRTRDHGIDTEPKTISSQRELPLFHSVKEFIENQRTITGEQEYLFISYRKQPFANTGSICQHHWYPLLDQLNLPRRRLYELRHTFATNMLNSGHFKVTEIAHLMGHTTTEYLFNVYSKYIESEKDSIPLDKNIY